MTSHDLRPNDRETLSALFDGELDGEARLFALRRLGHDAGWQDDCGRWQLIGDALRRQAPVAAPVDFAGRISTAIAREAMPVAPAVSPRAVAARPRRMRWIGGGALAASVALAAVVGSLSTGRAPDTAAPAVVAVAPPQSPAAPAPVVPSPAGPSTIAVPAADVPDRARPSPEPSPVRVASTSRRARPAVAPTVERVDAMPAVAEASLLAGASGNPFNLATDEALTARPWPRAALGTATGAFTARYGAAGDSAGRRPSFYPFEPRPQAEPDQAPSP